MAQFTLEWDNSGIQAVTNVLHQQAVYRYRTVGGAFLSTGFTPANPLGKTATTTDSPVLTNNRVVQFKVQTLCTVSGPTDNDNGIIEAIEFAAISPVLTKTTTTVEMSLSLLNTDITKVRAVMKKTADNTVVYDDVLYRATDAVSTTVTGLTPDTNYFWQFEFYVSINGGDVVSSSGNYSGTPYSPYPVKTDAASTCGALTSATIESIEV